MVGRPAAMLPSRLFRSRWSALFWAGGVLWTAYDVATAQQAGPAGRGVAPTKAAGMTRDAMGDVVEANDLAILANAGG